MIQGWIIGGDAMAFGMTAVGWLIVLVLAALPMAGCAAPAAGGGGGEGGRTWPPFQVAAESQPRVPRVDGAPRKVVIGTMCHSMFGTFPGLDARCEELKRHLEEMESQARAKYHAGLDLVVFPEFALNNMRVKAPQSAIALDGPGFAYFQKLAREHHTYIIIPSIITDGGKFYNSAILLDRNGAMMGRYDKAHPCPDPAPATTFEGGVTPGTSFPVFDCDFGRLGMQICFDYCHEEGWHELALNGAEIVAYHSQSPTVSIAAARAVNNRYYVVSSTWRTDAMVVDPVGRLVAELRPQGAAATPKDDVLVTQIDLEYRLLPWDPKLQNGEALKKKFGDDVGFRFYPEEDMGVFWSNNPKVPIDAMVRSIGIWTQDEYEAVARKRLSMVVPAK
jgi:predicted amidohydrolase